MATAAHVPVVPPGGGSGRQGGSLAIHGGIVLDLRAPDQVVAIDEVSRQALTAEPGAAV